MNWRASVSGCLGRLDAGDFQSEIIQQTLPLIVGFGVAWWSTAEQFSRYCETLAEHEVGRRGANVRLQGRADCQQDARQFPKPLIWFIDDQSVE